MLLLPLTRQVLPHAVRTSALTVRGQRDKIRKSEPRGRGLKICFMEALAPFIPWLEAGTVMPLQALENMLLQNLPGLPNTAPTWPQELWALDWNSQGKNPSPPPPCLVRHSSASCTRPAGKCWHQDGRRPAAAASKGGHQLH